MPRIDGRKVAAAIKQLAPATPIILLTGWGQRLLDEKDIPANIDRVLSKPPRLAQLKALGDQIRAAEARGDLPSAMVARSDRRRK